MGNSSISLDPDAPEGRCRGTLLLRKSWKFKLEGNQAQIVKGACLKLCRGGSTLEGKFRYLGSLPSGPAASVFCWVLCPHLCLKSGPSPGSLQGDNGSPRPGCLPIRSKGLGAARTQGLLDYSGIVRVGGLQVWPQSATKAVRPASRPARPLVAAVAARGSCHWASSFELFAVLLRPQFPHLGSAGLPVTSFPPGQEDEVGRFANPWSSCLLNCFQDENGC